MMRAFGLVVLLVLAGGCGGSLANQVLVGSASSFAQVFDGVDNVYDRYDVKALVGGSQLLVTQILEGAPMDVIVTADWPTMLKLVDADRTLAPPIILARNGLVIAVEAGNPLGVGSIPDLVAPELNLVLADVGVPLGAYSAQVFAMAGLEAAPVSRAASATAVAGLISSGEADVGLLYETDAALWGLTPIPIAAELAVATEYYIAPLADSPNPIGGADLIEFLLGAEGQGFISALGFKP